LGTVPVEEGRCARARQHPDRARPDECGRSAEDSRLIRRSGFLSGVMPQSKRPISSRGRAAYQTARRPKTQPPLAKALSCDGSDEALLLSHGDWDSFIGAGDTLVVTKPDRLARSVFNLVTIGERLEGKGRHRHPSHFSHIRHETRHSKDHAPLTRITH